MRSRGCVFVLLVLLVFFVLFALFAYTKLFCKKIIKEFKIALMTSFTLLLFYKFYELVKKRQKPI